jgi:hypothetical protein
MPEKLLPRPEGFHQCRHNCFLGLKVFAVSKTIAPPDAGAGTRETLTPKGVSYRPLTATSMA